MFRWLPANRKCNQFTINSRLLLLGSPYFYSTSTIFTFGKEECSRFKTLFRLISTIITDLLNTIQTKSKLCEDNAHFKYLKDITTAFARLVSHQEVLENLDNLNKMQFKKYIEDINYTCDILESLNGGLIEYLPPKVKTHDGDFQFNDGTIQLP